MNVSLVEILEELHQCKKKWKKEVRATLEAFITYSKKNGGTDLKSEIYQADNFIRVSDLHTWMDKALWEEDEDE